MSRSFSPRWINVLLGAWLFISAFLWQHTPDQFINAWLVGLAAIVSGVFAMRVDAVRFVNVGLAVWLAISVWALELASLGTTWNNLIVAVAMFLTGLTPQPKLPETRRESHTVHTVHAHR